ncbi:MAG TPA: hypothetical protein VGB09_02655 [Candidatus Binatia bacterium]
MKHKITLIPGDGIGPEVTKPALAIIKAAGVLMRGEVMTRDLGGNATTRKFADAIIREIER